METLTVRIGGMTCGGCADSVVRVLRAVAGVHAVDVSLEREAATVQYDPKLASREALQEAVESAGFDASL